MNLPMMNFAPVLENVSVRPDFVTGREDKSFVEFSFESSGGTFPIAPTGTVAAYPRSADDTSHVAFVDLLLDDDDDE